MPLRNILTFACCLALFLQFSCNGSEPGKATKDPGDSVKAKKELKDDPKKESNPQKPPIINIVDSVAPKRIVVYMKDSAATMERISIKLGQIYGVKLAEFFRKNGLKPAGAPLAWYSTQKAPFFFEAGMPVNKKPAKQTAGVMVRELPADSVVIAHFYGPYNLMRAGYDALKEWMQDHKRRATGAPYEIYISDPLDKKGKPVDPYKIQTDIIFPRK